MQHKLDRAIAVLEVEAKILEAHAEKLSNMALHFDDPEHHREIIELSHRGVPGPFIVHYLRPTYFVYKLTPEEVSLMRKSGVEEGVIHYLSVTPAMFSPQQAPVWVEDDPFYSGSHKDYWRY